LFVVGAYDCYVFVSVPQYWTLEEAESARDAKHAPSLDEDSLGHLETDIRSLGQLLRKGDTQVRRCTVCHAILRCAERTKA
jgi:hypothetical protein